MKTHLSGIIPLANYETDIEVGFPEFLLPAQNGFSLIQKSVFECAMAGCDTIWIVANEDLAPITRKIIGDWVYDPVYFKRDLASKFYTELRKEVPIYYVGIHPKDRDRRDSYGWSILQGIYTAYKTSYSMSKWLYHERRRLFTMSSERKQKDNKGVFTPFTRPAISKPKIAPPRKVVSPNFQVRRYI